MSEFYHAAVYRDHWDLATPWLLPSITNCTDERLRLLHYLATGQYARFRRSCEGHAHVCVSRRDVQLANVRGQA